MPKEMLSIAEIPEVTYVEVRPQYRLLLRFRDGLEGVITLLDLVPFKGVFAELRDPDQFAKVALNSELGTVVWPSGADLDPAVLHDLVRAQVDAA